MLLRTDKMTRAQMLAVLNSARLPLAALDEVVQAEVILDELAKIQKADEA